MATQAAEGAGSVSRTPIEREILKVEKKLREVEKLSQKRDAGETLDVLQLQKIAKEDSLRKSLEELTEQREAEIASNCAVADATPGDVTEDRSVGTPDADGEVVEEPDQAVNAPDSKSFLFHGKRRKQFDSRCLHGDWLDNFGQRILVKHGYRRRGRTGTMITYTYRAIVLKAGERDKRLTIHYDQEVHEWRCGNGTLEREATSWDEIHWTCASGRNTHWSRTPHDGPIYFDSPPDAYGQTYQQTYDSTGQFGYCDGATYFDASNVEDDAWSRWEDGWTQAAQEEHICLVPMETDLSSGGLEPVQEDAVWEPRDESSAAKSADRLMSELLQPPLQLTSSESSLELHITSNRLDWVVPDTWGRLKVLEKQGHLTSPSFDVQGSPGMRLEFYPNGTKSTEDGFCTLQLTREPESKVGIKFELCINGRSSGPKACLGRRYLGDYPKPFDASEHDKSKHVVVTFSILSAF